MKILVSINREFAEIAIQHYLYYEMKVSNRKVFIEAIESYLRVFGSSCIDDHILECSEFSAEAYSIVDKYFKK